MKIKITKVPKDTKPQQQDTLQDMSNIMAIGGDIQTHGADWTTGLRKIGAGGTHESNKYEGVQVGVDPEGKPNLVEENETIFNDYVYSNRIYADGGTLAKFHLPKNKKITYAGISKNLEKEAFERPNDPISRAALKVQMANLAEEQERQKQEMQAEEAQEAFAQLSPEEQVAVMQQIQAQQQGQPSPEEQAMMEQQAMQEQGMGQPQMSPEEQAMMEQQMAMQGGGQPMMGGAPPMGIDAAMAQQAMSQQGMPQEAMMPQQPMMAYGGRVNTFGGGGLLDKIKKWLAKNDYDATMAQQIYDLIIDANEKKNISEKDFIKRLKRKDLNKIFSDYYTTLKVYDSSGTPEVGVYTDTPELSYPSFDNWWAQNINSRDELNSEGGRYIDYGKLYRHFYPNSEDDLTQSIAVRNALERLYREPDNRNAFFDFDYDRDIINTGTPNTNNLVADTLGEVVVTGNQPSVVSVVSTATRPQQLVSTQPSSGSSISNPSLSFSDFTSWYDSLPLKDDELQPFLQNLYDKEFAKKYPYSKEREKVAETDPMSAVMGALQDIFEEGNNKDIFNRYSNNISSTKGNNTGGTSSSAYAGPITLGANLNTEIMNALGLRTWEGLQNWLKENKVSDSYLKNKTWSTMTDEDWSKLLQDPTFKAAFAKGSPALAHALSLYNDPNVPLPTTTQVTANNLFPVSSTGSWGNSTFKDWWGNGDRANWDPMFREVVEGLEKEGVKDLNGEYSIEMDDFIKRLQGTKSYQDTTRWLKASPDNMRMYLQAVLKGNSPEKAKEWARKWINEETGEWIPDSGYSYDKIFGLPNGKREDRYPGTYWYSIDPKISSQILGANIAENYLRNKDGNWELMVTGVPEGWKPQNEYTWDINGGKRTARYYVDPASKAAVKDAAKKASKGMMYPILEDERLKYASAAGPLVALAMMGAGVGKPLSDVYNGIVDAYSRNGAHLASMEPVGNYLKYVPQDFFTSANAATAAATGAARAIANAGGTAGSVQASNLANTRNLMSSIGDIHSKGQAANFDTNAKVTAHNAGIDQFNATAFNQLSQFNAGVLNDVAKMRAQLGLQSESEKAAQRAAWYNALYGNVGEFTSALGALGKDAMYNNQFNSLLATGALGGGNPEHPMFMGKVAYYDDLTDAQKKRLKLRNVT